MADVLGSCLAYSTARLLILRLIGALAAFLSSVALTRVLGAVDAAGIFTAIGICALGAGVARLGMDVAVTRQVAILREKNAPVAESSFAFSAYFVTLAVGITVTVLVRLATPLFDPGVHRVIAVIATSIPALAIVGLAGAVLIGQSRQGFSLLVQSIALPVSFAVGVVALGPMLGSQGVAYAYVTSMWIIAFVAVVVSLPTCKFPKFSFGQVLALVAVAPPLFIVGLGKIWMESGGPILLGLLGGESDPALYAAGARITGVIAFLVVAVELYVTPRFAVLVGQASSIAERLALFKTGQRQTITIGVPIVLSVMIQAPTVLSVFGPEFQAAANALRILCLGQLVNALTGPCVAVVLMAGKYRLMAWLTLVAGTGSFLLGWVLIPAFGLDGAAAAFSIAICLMQGMAYVEARKLLVLHGTEA